MRKEYFIILLILIGISIPIIIYINNFGDFKLSDNPNNWGVFGDYLGGVLNPLLALINILVLIYITTLVKDSEDKRNKENLLTQKKIILSQLRYDTINKFNLIFEPISLLHFKTDWENLEIDTVQKIYIKILIFKANYRDLFSSFFNSKFSEEHFDPMLKAIVELKDELKIVCDYFDAHKINADELTEIKKKLLKISESLKYPEMISKEEKDKMYSSNEEIRLKLEINQDELDILKKKINTDKLKEKLDYFLVTKEKFISVINIFIVTDLE